MRPCPDAGDPKARPKRSPGSKACGNSRSNKLKRQEMIPKILVPDLIQDARRFWEQNHTSLNSPKSGRTRSLIRHANNGFVWQN
jgi:hypothetical protein